VSLVHRVAAHGRGQRLAAGADQHRHHGRVGAGAAAHDDADLAGLQAHRRAWRVDAEFLDDGRGEGVALLRLEELPGRLVRQQRLARRAAAELGGVGVCPLQQLGQLADVAGAARVAAAVGLLVVRAHGGQPVGVAHAGALQQFGTELRVVVQGLPLQRRGRADLRGQLILQLHHRQVHRQRGAEQAVGGVAAPAQPLRGQLAGDGGVHRVAAGVRGGQRWDLGAQPP